jgi:hypothetical protein
MRLWRYNVTNQQPMLLLNNQYWAKTFKSGYGGMVSQGANPNPPSQHSLWKETGVPRENPRLSIQR